MKESLFKFPKLGKAFFIVQINFSGLPKKLGYWFYKFLIYLSTREGLVLVPLLHRQLRERASPLWGRLEGASISHYKNQEFFCGKYSCTLPATGLPKRV